METGIYEGVPGLYLVLDLLGLQAGAFGLDVAFNQALFFSGRGASDMCTSRKS